MSLPQTWSEDDLVDAATIEQYKAYWAKHGFPDVDHSPNSRVEVAGINEPSYPETPETNLWKCVLNEAFVDLERGRQPKPSARQKIDAADAAEWFASYAKTEGSFEWVCDMLGLNPSYVRRKVAEGHCVSRPGRHYISRTQPMSQAKPQVGSHSGGWYKESL